MTYLPGEIYNVPCAEIALKEDGLVYYLPVIDLPHTDLGFDFLYRHYHIDGRFEIHPRMKHRLKIADGYTLTVLLTEGTSIYEFRGVSPQQVRCERTGTGLAVPEGSEKYLKWYQAYIGQTCAGRKCPHLGMELMEQGDNLVCPLHGLTADAHTLKVIPVLT